MYNRGYWPEIVNNFHLYDSQGEQLIGIGSQVTLPDLSVIAETLSGSGILGEIEASNPGHFSAMEMTIPYTAANEGMYAWDTQKRQYITIRSTQQSTYKATGEKVYSGVKIIIGGDIKGFTTGKLENGTQMDSSVTLGVTYIKIGVRYEDGTEVTALELDKFNEVFILNGEDQLARIKSFD